MKRTIIAQPIASTTLDMQGEQHSDDDLYTLLESMPERVPLHQHHDMRLPICGDMTNFRIVSYPDDQSHLMLVCDATYDDELIEGSTLGYSYSALRGLKSNSSAPDYCVYLPFPLYKDNAIIDALLACDKSLDVGKWVKKEANSTILIAMIVFFAKPLWDTIYKEVLEKQVKRLVDRIKRLWPENTQLNCRVEVPTKDPRKI